MDGCPSVADLDHLGRAVAGAGEDLGPDGGRLLAARVVVGHHEDVGQPRGDLAHDRALAGVALAAGAEDHDEPAVGQRAQCCQGGGDGVGLVRVVDDDGEVLPLVDPLEPAGHATALGHRPGDVGEVEPRRGAGREGGQRVGHVEVAGQRAAGLDPYAARAGDHEGGPGRRHLDVLGPPVGVAARGREGLERDAAALEQASAVLVVGVHETADAPLGGEQRRLGLEVVLDVGVEVEVVAAQVGEDRHVEDDAVDATLHERVAGDLHGAGGDATLLHHREQRVQVRRLGRGQRRLDLLGVHPRADGADHPGPSPPRAGGRSRRDAWWSSCPGCRSRRASAATARGRRTRAPRSGRAGTSGRRPRAPAVRSGPGLAPSLSVSTATAPASTADAT